MQGNISSVILPHTQPKTSATASAKTAGGGKGREKQLTNIKHRCFYPTSVAGREIRVDNHFKFFLLSASTLSERISLPGRLTQTFIPEESDSVVDHF